MVGRASFYKPTSDQDKLVTRKLNASLNKRCYAGNCPDFVKLIEGNMIQAWNLPLGIGEASYQERLCSKATAAATIRRSLCSFAHDQRCSSQAPRTHKHNRNWHLCVRLNSKYACHCCLIKRHLSYLISSSQSWIKLSISRGGGRNLQHQFCHSGPSYSCNSTSDLLSRP